ncbi:MAG: hypothetical protein IT581_02290 [Verrucomicrobiales bacterium]|nr:hypothetical protein [Verrucomicrobiales bacterium]
MTEAMIQGVQTPKRATGTRWSLLAAGAACCLAGNVASPARAGLPEPDVVFFGSIAIEGTNVTSRDIDVLVEIRRAEEGPAIASYRMGDGASYGDRYVIRAKVESRAPIDDPEASALGDSVVVVVSKSGTVKAASTQVLSARGAFVNVNFGDIDSDGDGMSDAFEQRYFGSVTGGNADVDTDNDGRPNRREFQQGTNPLVADGRHPADLAPADNALGIQEVTSYTLAWQTGASWSIEPTNIPIAYVTRANLLWQTGENYVFLNTPPTNAPNWWVSAPNTGAALSGQPKSGGPTLMAVGDESGAMGQADRTLPQRFESSVPFRVETAVQPAAGVAVYAVEDRIPEGVIVREISDGGRFDRVNRKVKWGPFFDRAPRQLAYMATALTAAGDRLSFQGVGSFDGTDVEIGGARLVSTADAGAFARLVIVSQPNSVRLRIEAGAGLRFAIESSTDLVAWSAVGVVTAGDAAGVQVTTAAQEGHGAVFYRARLEGAAEP